MNHHFPSLKKKIQEIFDVESYIITLVVEISVANDDSYSWRGNNYWLYNNPDTGKFVFLPYDYDESWGIGGAQNLNWTQWAKYNVYDWGVASLTRYPAPLTQRILSVPNFRNMFTNYFWIFLNLFSGDSDSELALRAQTFRNFFLPEIKRDYYYTLDFPRNYKTYSTVLEKSLFPYVQLRHISAMQQLDPPTFD